MTVTVEIADEQARPEDLQKIFDYFHSIDSTFSTYKTESEISRINRREIVREQYSPEMKEVFDLSEKTTRETDGFFDIKRADGTFDPSGLVKGWAIHNAALLIKKMGFRNFFVDAGGDIEVGGKNSENRAWSVGIKNPFNEKEIVKVVYLKDGQGIATSGTYIRGQHIYNPKKRDEVLSEIVSLSVIGPNIYEADRFATAAFAMGRNGIIFIEKLPGFEAYMIDQKGQATLTSGFEHYTHA